MSSTIDPLIAIILAVFIPAFVIIFICLFLERHSKESISLKLSKFYVERSGCILSLTIPIAILLILNQTRFIITNLSFGGDINYYLSVNLAEYDAIGTINTAISQTSLGNYLKLQSYSHESRRLVSQSSTFIIAYHTKNYDQNKLKFQHLINLQNLYSYNCNWVMEINWG